MLLELSILKEKLRNAKTKSRARKSEIKDQEIKKLGPKTKSRNPSQQGQDLS